MSLADETASRAASAPLAPPAARPAGAARVLGLRWPWLAGLLLAGGAIVAAGAWAMRQWGPGGPDGQATPATVKRGPMRVVVTADGNIRSDRTIELKSELEGMNRILEIAPESSRVERGQFLFRLDISDFEKSRDVQEIKSKQARANAELAEKELEILIAQSASEVNKAVQARLFAHIERLKYLRGDWPQQYQEADSAIVIATEELQRAKDKWEWSRRLAEQGYISGTELAADELAVTKCKLDLDVARTKMRVLREYTYRKESTKRRSDYREARAELMRARTRAEAMLAKARTDMETKREAAGLEDKQLRKLHQMVNAGTTTAPASGLVVYATTGRWRNNRQEQIDVGYQVREGESIISLPDLSIMVADVSIPEARRTEIVEGQPAVIRVEVRPNHPLVGRVKSCGVMPVQQNFWQRGDVQQFQVVVQIHDPPGWLLPGLRCSAQITVRELSDALQVPMQAVFVRGGQQFCYAVDGQQTRAVPVLIGSDDDKMVEIKAGLQEGWQVLLAEPPNGSSIPLESPTFRMPTVVPLPVLPPAATQPAEAAATQPADLPTDEQVNETIARLRARRPEVADRLLKMSPEARRRAVLEIRRQRGNDRPRDDGGGNRGQD